MQPILKVIFSLAFPGRWFYRNVFSVNDAYKWRELELFHDGGRYQWTGFYMITASFMKEFNNRTDRDYWISAFIQYYFWSKIPAYISY